MHQRDLLLTIHLSERTGHFQGVHEGDEAITLGFVFVANDAGLNIRITMTDECSHQGYMCVD